MKNKKSALPDHVIRAMRRGDGFIRAEIVEDRVKYVVNLRTADGYKQYCTISEPDVKRLWDEDAIKYIGDGKWKLTEHVDGEKHRL